MNVRAVILSICVIVIVLVKKFVIDKLDKDLSKGLSFVAILGAHFFGSFLSSVSW
jgi:hypothetical protein